MVPIRRFPHHLQDLLFRDVRREPDTVCGGGQRFTFLRLHHPIRIRHMQGQEDEPMCSGAGHRHSKTQPANTMAVVFPNPAPRTSAKRCTRRFRILQAILHLAHSVGPGLEARLQEAHRLGTDAKGRLAAAKAFAKLMEDGDAQQRLQVLRFAETHCADWYVDLHVAKALPDVSKIIQDADDLYKVVALTAPGNPPDLRDAAYAAIQYGATPKQILELEPTLSLWSRTRSEAANLAARGAWARLCDLDPTGFEATWLRWVQSGDLRRLHDAVRFLATAPCQPHMDALCTALVPAVAAAPESHHAEVGRTIGEALLDWHHESPHPAPSADFATAAVALMAELRNKTPEAFQYGTRSYENILFCALAGAHRNGHADALPAYLDAAVSWSSELVQASDAEGWMILMESVAPGMEELFQAARPVEA